MSYSLNKEDDSFEDIINDLDEQIEFHKNNLINSKIEVVGSVLDAFLVAMTESIPNETLSSALPILQALSESVLELRERVDVLQGEIIHRGSPPPDNLHMN
jgi:hypothetical protein|tara:strand:+ start:290 stop:592 length:303 start_codon:yes stop_codon:yes gene_type:complete